MEQESRTIERHIRAEGEALGRDLEEIGRRVRNAADIRGKFDQRPFPFLFATLGAGFVFGSLTNGRSQSHWSPGRDNPPRNIGEITVEGERGGGTRHGQPRSGTRRSGEEPERGTPEERIPGSVPRTMEGMTIDDSRHLSRHEWKPTSIHLPEEIVENLRVVRIALIGVATEQLRRFLAEALPDFDEQYRRAEQREASRRPARGARGDAASDAGPRDESGGADQRAFSGNLPPGWKDVETADSRPDSRL